MTLCIITYNDQIMKKISLILVLLIIFPSVAKKLQVCSITLNSDNEIQIFKKHLSSKAFSFIELAPQHHNLDHSSSEAQWFNKTCQNSNVQCDVLVISGHFADMFFGTDNKHILSVYELEKIACQQRCPRVFSQLKEVFLFGCNTMAGKEKLYRTSNEYLNILINDHNMPPSMAEIIVASRYSNFNPTYKDRMEHIFEPRTRIYGFKEISPYGNQSESALNKYFLSMESQYGSYVNYLKSYSDSPQPNPHFSSAFNTLSATQQSFGMNSSHPRYSAYQQLCYLYNSKISNSKKMKTVYNLFNQNSEFFAFSAIKNFLAHNIDLLDKSSQKLFLRIQKNKVKSREKFIQSYASLSSNLVYMKSQILHFLHLMSWISPSQYQLGLKENLLPLIQKSNTQSFDILNTLIYENNLNSSDITINYNDLGSHYLKNIWGVLIVDILNLNTPDMQKYLIRYCEKKLQTESFVDCYQVLKTLGNIQATEPDVLEKMTSFLDSKDFGLVYYATYGLTYSNASNAEILFKIVQNLEHSNPWIRLQSLQSLDYLGIINASRKVKQRVENMLLSETNGRVISEINLILSN